MKLIWTYDGKMSKGDDNSRNRIILINYYIHSILTAKKFGYTTIIYCDSGSEKYFNNIADEIHIVDSYEPTLVWDYLKVKVLEDREDDFYLIDGDVILHDRLPKFTTDVIFDSYETTAFKYKYKNILTELTKMGIKEVIDIWDDKQLPILSCGVLSIRNSLLKEKYVHYWKRYNQFIIDHIDMVLCNQ